MVRESENGRPGVLANWNADVGFRPDAIGWNSVWAEFKKPPFLSWERRLFLLVFTNALAIRTGKEIRFRFWLSEDKAGKEAKRRTTGW